MTPEEALKRLNELAEETNPSEDIFVDLEDPHGEADDILCQLVPKEIAEAYNRIGKWYS